MTIKVRGYIKKNKNFHSYQEWKNLVDYLLQMQGIGIDTRGGSLSCKTEDCDNLELNTVEEAIQHYFGHLYEEAEQYSLINKKSVDDFIEDFVNHKFWEFDTFHGKYFTDVKDLRFSFFQSRGDIEPYVLLDENFSEQIYGTNFNLMEVCHFTSEKGLKNLNDSIENDKFFDISTMTVRSREFFRPESNIEVRLLGNVKAAFRSDVKSFAVDTGHRAANLMRFEYPGNDKVNLCYDLSSCDDDLRTGLWNEIIVTPVKIISAKTVK